MNIRALAREYHDTLEGHDKNYGEEGQPSSCYKTMDVHIWKYHIVLERSKDDEIPADAANEQNDNDIKQPMDWESIIFITSYIASFITLILGFYNNDGEFDIALTLIGFCYLIFALIHSNRMLQYLKTGREVHKNPVIIKVSENTGFFSYLLMCLGLVLTSIKAKNADVGDKVSFWYVTGLLLLVSIAMYFYERGKYDAEHKENPGA